MSPLYIYIHIYFVVLDQELDANIDRRIVEVRNQIDLKVESLKFEIDKSRDKLFEKLESIKNKIKKWVNDILNENILNSKFLCSK